MKKIFTLFAALTMVLSMFAATETVYFVNAQDWPGTITAHAWDGSATGTEWPGLATVKEADQIGGKDVYSFTAEAGAYAKVIFTNKTDGDKQTGDLDWTAGKYYCKDGWYTKEEAAAKLEQPIEYEAVYFVDNQGWGKANIYTWTPEVGTWPGVAMTKEAEQLAGYDVYSYTVEKGTSFGGVIFNNGSSQTANLVWTAGKYYVKDGWYTKEEAIEKLSAPVTPPVITYVLMGVAGDWTTGIALTANPDNANEYVLLDQTISEGDAVKVVTLTDGVATAWCGNVDEYSVEHSADDMGNIVLAPGKYNFYYKVAEDLIYIGAVAPELPTYDVTVADATVSTMGQNIVLSGNWEEKLLTVSLWQGGATQGFGTYAAEDYAPIFLGTAELTPTSEGVYADNGDNTFTFTATANDAEGGIYNISVTGAIPAAEIEWISMPLEISNLTTTEMPVGDVTYLQLMGRNDMEDADVMLFLNDYTGEEKAYEVNAESSSVTFGGMEFTVMDGSITKSVDPEKGDVFAGTVHASVVDEEVGEMYVEFALTMYALPPIAIELEDVEIVVNEESAIAFFNATWEGSPLQVEVSGFEEVEFKEYEECWLSIGDDVNWVDAAAGPAAVIIEDGVAMLEGEFTSFATGKTYEVMLTGTLPVEEPEVITWELNGGELVVEVPTQEELWASFKTAAGLTTLGTLAEITEAGAGTPHSDQNNPCACRIICAKLLDANVNAVFALPEWAWLKAYIMTVQSGLPEASSAAWRYAIAAFFLQSEHNVWPASADFTEAGKPENWGAAYEAAHEVVLPTEPVAEEYVLPTPVKTGYTFVGWYDNAEGTGEAYTVIPAGWSGTLYAIWKQNPTTALENIAVEGKVVKAIVNGQLIIIKNGVQYNAQGAVVK